MSGCDAGQVEKWEQALLQADTVIDVKEWLPAVSLQQLKEIEEGEVQDSDNDIEEKVVVFTPGTMGSWHTDPDSQELELTPPPKKKVRFEVPQNQEERARKSLQLHGLLAHRFKRQDPRPPTVVVLTDELLANWSERELCCVVIRKHYSTINGWIPDIREAVINTDFPHVVVVMQCVRSLECLETLKNAMGGLCRALRSINPVARIYFCDGIPRPRSAPVIGQRIQEHNKLLAHAVKGVNQLMGRVFYLSMATHFIDSSTGKVPVEYFNMYEDRLSRVGCFIFRSCMFREVGVVPYSLDPFKE